MRLSNNLKRELTTFLVILWGVYAAAPVNLQAWTWQQNKKDRKAPSVSYFGVAKSQASASRNAQPLLAQPVLKAQPVVETKPKVKQFQSLPKSMKIKAFRVSSPSMGENAPLVISDIPREKTPEKDTLLIKSDLFDTSSLESLALKSRPEPLGEPTEFAFTTKEEKMVQAKLQKSGREKVEAVQKARTVKKCTKKKECSKKKCAEKKAVAPSPAAQPKKIVSTAHPKTIVSPKKIYSGKEIIQTYPEDEWEEFEGEYGPEEDIDFRIHPHLGIQFAHDDNILTQARNPVGDFVWTFSPGLSAQIGREDPDNPNYSKVAATYTAHVVRFMDEDEHDTIDQEAELIVRYNLQKLTLELEQDYETRSDSTVDLTTRENRDIYRTFLKAKYDVSDKTSVELTGAQFVTNYSTATLSDKMEWNAQAFLNYQILPKVNIGFGPTFGWLDTQGNPNQTYQEILGRVIWEPTEKLTVTGEAGLEIRQFQDDVIDERFTPIFALGAVYEPFDGTELGVRAFRGVKNSASLTGQNFVITGGSAYVRQRFLQDFYFNLAGGYELAEYYRATLAPYVDREDRYFTIEPSVTYAFADWGSVSVFYLYRDNESNIPNLEFENNIIGIRASFRY